MLEPIIAGISPQQLVDFLTHLGLSPQGNRTTTGAAYVAITINEMPCRVMFFGTADMTDAGALAQVLQFCATFDARGIDAVRSVQEWNSKAILGKTFVGMDGDIEFEQAACVTGVTVEYITKVLELVSEALSELHGFLYKDARP